MIEWARWRRPRQDQRRRSSSASPWPCRRAAALPQGPLRARRLPLARQQPRPKDRTELERVVDSIRFLDW